MSWCRYEVHCHLLDVGMFMDAASDRRRRANDKLLSYMFGKHKIRSTREVHGCISMKSSRPILADTEASSRVVQEDSP